MLCGWEETQGLIFEKKSEEKIENVLIFFSRLKKKMKCLGPMKILHFQIYTKIMFTIYIIIVEEPEKERCLGPWTS